MLSKADAIYSVIKRAWVKKDFEEVIILKRNDKERSGCNNVLCNQYGDYGLSSGMVNKWKACFRDVLILHVEKELLPASVAVFNIIFTPYALDGWSKC